MANLFDDESGSYFAEPVQDTVLRHSFGPGVFEATVPPTVGDDDLDGFRPNSLWFIPSDRRLWLCTDSTTGAAVWDEIGIIGSDFDTAARIEVICRNNISPSATIPKMRAVYVTGAIGNHPTIALADKSSEATSSKTLGLTIEDIAHNGDGRVAVNGTVFKLDTSAWTAGTALWLGDDGQLTSTKPTPTDHAVFIGWVTRSNNSNGEILLHIQNGYEIEELHDVLITSPANNEVLTYDGGLWKNKPVKQSVEVVGRFYTDAAVSDDTDTLFTYTIPAGKMGTNGDILRGRYSGDCLTTGGGGIAAVSFDGIVYGPLAFPDLVSGNWDLNFYLVRVSSTSARLTVNATWVDTSAGLTNKVSYNSITTGVDFTGTEEIGLYLSADEFTTVTGRMGLLELLIN